MLLNNLFCQADACKLNHQFGGACYRFHEVVKKNWATAVRSVTRKRVTNSATLSLNMGAQHDFESCEAAVYRKHGDRYMVEYHMKLTLNSLCVKVRLLRPAKAGAKRSLQFEHFGGKWHVARTSNKIVVPGDRTLTEAVELAEAALLLLLPGECA